MAPASGPGETQSSRMDSVFQSNEEQQDSEQLRKDIERLFFQYCAR